MARRALTSLSLVLLLGTLLPAPVTAQTTPTCFGEPATIVGTDARDVLEGTDGRDVIYSGRGDDEIRGFGGHDLLCGGPGNDLINGNDGDDRIDAQRGGGNVSGGPGDDYATGFHISGDGGDDRLVCAVGWNYINVFAGPGHDVVDCRDADRASIVGSTGNDRLIGSVLADAISAGPGNDVLRGLGGADSLIGGADDDQIWGGAGRDTAHYSPAPNPVRVDLADELARGWGTDELVDIERIFGSAFDDTLLGDGGRNFFIGYNGEDVLKGRGGNDGLGGDFPPSDLRQQGSDDRIYGGSGTDIVFFSAPVTADMRDNSSSGDGADLFYGIEGLRGSRGADSLFGTGDRDLIYGNEGPDRIWGRSGDDRIDAGKGDDAVDGGSGTDNCLNGEMVNRCE